MHALSAALLIAAKDLRQRLRDRSALVLGFVAPLGIAALMSTAFGGADDFHFRMGVVDDDGGALADAFGELLSVPELADIVTVERFDTGAEARDAVDDGDVDTAVIVPAGFSAAAVAPEPADASLTILASTDSELAANVAGAITAGFLAQVNANRLSVATALAAGAPAGDLDELAAAVVDERLPEQAVRRSIGAEELRTISYYAPGMGILFVLFAVGFAARSYFGERQTGTLERMAVAPVPRVAILAGKAISVFAYAAASLTTTAIVTGAVFGADWGHPLAAATVIAAIALAVVALTALVVTISRNDRQADGLAALVVFVLALLGGNFVFISEAPPIMRSLSLLTPNGWALRAFTDLATTSGGAAHDLGIVAGPAAAIVAWTAVVAAVAALLSRRIALR